MATKHAKPGSTAAPARAQRPPVRTLYDREFWSISRHELIAAAAEELLSPDAKTEVKKLLKPIGVAFPDIAGWADEVKRRKPRRGDDPDTVDFLEDERNAHADTWHYVDLPVGAHEYSRRTYPEFTRPDDVVQMLAESIKVLQGASDRFSVLNALRLTVHLVGDVHQPLHVGCGYLDRSTEVPRLTRDPAIASRKKLESDHGGNYLILPIGSKGPNLHAYWDGRLGGSAPMHAPVAGPAFLTAVPPPALDRAERSALVARLLESPVISLTAFAAPTAVLAPLSQQPEEWGTESLLAAREAYKSLAIDKNKAASGNALGVRWEGREKYDQRCKPIVVSRLRQAAQRLSTVLNQIWS